MIARGNEILSTNININGDILITLASPMVRPYLDNFIDYLLGKDYTFKYRYYSKPQKIQIDEYTNKAYIPDKKRYGDMHFLSTKKYGTSRMNALAIIEHGINNRPIDINDTKWNGVREHNPKETQLACKKLNDIQEELRHWVIKTEHVRDGIVDAYIKQFALLKRRTYNGDDLEFPGMLNSFELRPYQKDDVKGILYEDETADSRNKVLCESVGAGKTAVIVAASMKLKQLHKSEKNLIVVPNTIIQQWADAFCTMYGENANVLIVNPKEDFGTKNRELTLKSIRDDNYDAIIMAISSFNMIPVSKQYLINEIKAETDRLNKKQAKILAKGKLPSQKLMKDRKKLSDLFVKYASMNDNEGICFDQLGITRLFIDEAQSLKNLPIASSIKVKGFSGAGSKKCANALHKIRCVQRNGGGVIFATGTPISNSLAELFSIQTYLQPELLLKTGNDSFDTWVASFAEITEDLELDVTTSKFLKTRRLSRFNNLKLLTEQFSQIAIYHNLQTDADLPVFNGYIDVVVKKTRALQEYLQELSSRASAVKAGEVSRAEDNMLLITTDGRKAALDIRLVDPFGMFNINSKVYRCSEKVAEIYFATDEQKSTQVVFCDLSTPKSSFNIYDELKRLLINEGIEESEIAFIHDYKTETQKRKLFAAVNNGEIRIVMGSTQKLGTGVNIQERLIAAHHLDVPWRPSDLVQREGRIIRQGNTNKEVFIYRYITEGSFDAYSWQLVEAKARFITEFTSGQNNINTATDIDDTVLSYAEIKALAIGNPKIKERVEKQNELNRLLMLKTKENEEVLVLKDNLRYMSELNSKQSAEIIVLETDSAISLANPRPKKASDERNKLKFDLYKSSTEYVNKLIDRTYMNYRGFSIVLPADMRQDEPYLTLVNNGTYTVEIGDSEKGILVRIDNAIDAIPQKLKALKEKNKSLEEERERTKRAITEHRANKYDGQIDELRKIIRQLDDEIMSESESR